MFNILLTFDLLQLNKWNTLEVGIAGQEAWLRVNDGDITLYAIDQPISDDVNWDLPMYVGGALPNLFPEHFQAIGGKGTRLIYSFL